MEMHKQHTCCGELRSKLVTYKDVFTDINHTWCFTDTTSSNMEKSVKDVWMSIVHTNSEEFHNLSQIDSLCNKNYHHNKCSLTSKDLPEHAGPLSQS